MARLKGTDLIFYLDASVVTPSAVAYAKDFDYSLSGNLVETTTFNDGDFNSYLPCGGKEITGNVNHFMFRDTDTSRGYNYFLNCWFTDVSIAVSYLPATGSDKRISGAVWVSNIKVNNPGNKDFVTFSTELKGCGKFTLV